MGGGGVWSGVGMLRGWWEYGDEEVCVCVCVGGGGRGGGRCVCVWGERSGGGGGGGGGWKGARRVFLLQINMRV